MIEVKGISQATNNQIEKDYSKLISLEHRKKFANFFIPFQLASLMAEEIFSDTPN
jgi:adenine-specific DNA-methyltransferase